MTPNALLISGKHCKEKTCISNSNLIQKTCMEMAMILQYKFTPTKLSRTEFTVYEEGSKVIPSRNGHFSLSLGSNGIQIPSKEIGQLICHCSSFTCGGGGGGGGGHYTITCVRYHNYIITRTMDKLCTLSMESQLHHHSCTLSMDKRLNYIITHKWVRKSITSSLCALSMGKRLNYIITHKWVRKSITSSLVCIVDGEESQLHHH